MGQVVMQPSTTQQQREIRQRSTTFLWNMSWATSEASYFLSYLKKHGFIFLHSSKQYSCRAQSKNKFHKENKNHFKKSGDGGGQIVTTPPHLVQTLGANLSKKALLYGYRREKSRRQP
tara:strand:- start:3263 stop:3616 length:354 start_codon:yes stop_codon:yes gene_type:complete